jgi:hypothetical protein
LNSARIASTDFCGPRKASMPAIWLKLAVHELEFVIKREMCVARSGRITP